ncbi:hypothetical protein [Treponema primitia]|uniref:hypothetical protein n=1 Tax=Treponema primitia TaxID=88058 RepID=UPI0002555188|nr:hypothetical protein [Treponema primitia]
MKSIQMIRGTMAVLLRGAGAGVLAALFLSCANPASPPQAQGGTAPAPAGTAQVRFVPDFGGSAPASLGLRASPALRAGSERTIFPSAPEPEDLYLEYTFTKGDAITTPEVDEDGVYTLEIRDDWTVTAKAYLDADHEQPVGESDATSFTVSDDADVQNIAIILNPIAGSGQGTIDYTISYPKAATFAAITLKKIGGDTPVTLNDPSEDVENTMTHKGTVEEADAGYYALTVQLKDDQGRTAGKNDVVHVYQNMKTTIDPADWTFTVADFTAFLVKTAAVTDLVAPATEVAPAESLNVDSEAPYTVTSLAWKLFTGGDSWADFSGGAFMPQATYRAVITLTARSGYKFSGSFTPTVNGTTSGDWIVSGGTIVGGDTVMNTLSFTVSFPATTGGKVAVTTPSWETTMTPPFTGSIPVGTVYPTPPATSVKYDYTWEKGFEAVTPEQKSGKFILAEGDGYTLTVNAYVDNVIDANHLVGTGTTIFSVANGDDKNVTVTLKPVTGNGTLKYTINYPSGATVCNLTLTKTGESPVILTATTSGTSLTKTGLPAGSYKLKAKLLNKDKTGVLEKSMTVHIYGNMTTTVTGTNFEFLAKDFKVGDPAVYGGWTGEYTTDKDNDLIKSITLTGKSKTILIGRKPNQQVSLKIDSNGDLQFRDNVGRGVPIGSYAEFQLINTDDNRSGRYIQEADLDLMGSSTQQWTPVTLGGGTFDGDDKAISNLYISYMGGGLNNQGLFGYVEHGVVSNVHIASGTVADYAIDGGGGGSSIAGVAGSIYDATIQNCSNNATINGFNSSSNMGGVVGYSRGGYVTNCFNTGSVTGRNSIGGVVGYSYSWSGIKACSNSGKVKGYENIGGVLGSNGSNSHVKACSNTGEVYGFTNVGGVLGLLESNEIVACYNTGNITNGYDAVGGVVGRNRTGAVIACYNTGSICKNLPGDLFNAGGVLGFNGKDPSYISIIGCYWTDIADDRAVAGVGSHSSGRPAGPTSQFSFAYWPTVDTNTDIGNELYLKEWGIGDGSDNGKYWKNLGNNLTIFNTNPAYPKLYWE